MPTRQQVEDSDPLTEIGAAVMLSYLRASAIYQGTPGAFASLDSDLTAQVDADTVKSKQLSAILDQIEALGNGTVGVSGGRYGVQYSLEKDREQLCGLALNVLYDTAAYGAGSDALGAISAQMIDPSCKRCGVCGAAWYACLSSCLGYRVSWFQ